MNKHFLVTVSNEVEHLSGVRFICSFFEEMSEHQLTLLHICRQDCIKMNEALGEMWQNPEDKNSTKLTVSAKRALNRAVTLVKKSRMSIDAVITKTVAERFGKVKDILTEGSEGLYDAIILGRRASYTLQWVFERPADEIAQFMIKDNCCTSPIWICPEIDDNRKNVLLCLDGSDNGYRTTDHVGYILSAQSQHDITLFHVNNTEGDSDEIFERAEALLGEHGIESDRINRRSPWGLTVAGSILSEADSGDYAAVAVGMHGRSSPGIMKNLNLAGGTTAKLISKMERSALWCCP